MELLHKFKKTKDLEPGTPIEKPTYTENDLGLPEKRFQPQKFKENSNQIILDKLEELNNKLTNIDKRLQVIEKIAKESQ